MKNTNISKRSKRRAGIKRLYMGLALGTLTFTPMVRAQQPEEQKGIDQGNYNIKQAVEFGGRLTSVSGDQQTYDTMVNLQEGPRLLNFTTEMRSLDGRGTLFDRFFFSNFGYGGDPNVVSALRISKNKIYSFDALFRHDENFWNYSILANPFNPAPPPANAPPGFNPLLNSPATVLNTQVVALSPHYFNTRRNMQNYGLTLLPDAKIRFRVGYNHSTNVGPTYSTIHEGTEQFLLQHWSSGLTQYRLGVDFRFFPRTNISYEQTWSYYKSDPGAVDQNQQFTLGPGFPPVDLGVSWNGPPCSPAFQPAGVVTPTCNGFYNYQSHWRSRMDAPTEQLSLQSNYFPALQLSGKFSYTGSDFNVYDYQQSFSGRVSRSALADYSETGPKKGRHVTVYGDFDASWQIAHDFSLVDSFHYSNWMEPAEYISTQCSFFTSSLIVPPNAFVPTAGLPANLCTTPAGLPTGTPAHSTSSGPDILVNLDSNFLKQQITTNLIEGQAQFSPRFGAYFGYRYTHRVIADNFYNTQNAIYFPNNAARGNCKLIDTSVPISQGNLPDGCSLNSDGSISFVTLNPVFSPPGVTDINTNSGVLGLWLKPTQHWTINVDADLGGADNTFTPLGARSYLEFRARAAYRSSSWLNMSVYFQTREGQNPVTNINLSEHNRNAGFSLSATPSENISVQFGYNYNNIFSQVLVCFTSDFAQSGLPACPGVSGLVQQASPYTSVVHTGFVDMLWTPVPRLSLQVGANLSGISGTELNLNPLSPTVNAPAGPLNSDWYQPYASISYRFAKQWSGHARWDYYGYREDSQRSYLDLYVPRSFHSNLVTLSIRFAF